MHTFVLLNHILFRVRTLTLVVLCMVFFRRKLLMINDFMLFKVPILVQMPRQYMYKNENNNRNKERSAIRNYQNEMRKLMKIEAWAHQILIWKWPYLALCWKITWNFVHFFSSVQMILFHEQEVLLHSKKNSDWFEPVYWNDASRCGAGNKTIIRINYSVRFVLW